MDEKDYFIYSFCYGEFVEGEIMDANRTRHNSTRNSDRNFNDDIQREAALKRVHEVFGEVQVVKTPDRVVKDSELTSFKDSWKAAEPDLQHRVVDVQLENLHHGIIDPVFGTLAAALKIIPEQSFSLLDVACASGYYNEVIRTLDPRTIKYQGSDYSQKMIAKARETYPDVSFDVQDLTQLTYADDCVDVCLVSGVLEHIPDYHRAIRECCRVAKKWVIVHRGFVNTGRKTESALVSQYNIVTPRTCLAERALVSEFNDQGFSLEQMLDVYPGATPARNWKTPIKALLRALGVWPTFKVTRTYLFRGSRS